MRLAWYAGASTALAAGVVISAFHQRANFYSAMVHLFQSNLSLMILVNLTILVYSSLVYGLQRLCYGQLRAVEVEQLYDKAWFAVTETCLAMTIFRDEIGGSFIVMFVALLTGKVWGWIGEGRVEALEQQPPANPRLFHTRLSISLLLSLAYDSLMLHYTVQTVIESARADMMVMFLFEFAVLTIASCHTALRYGIVLVDSWIIHNQTQERLRARRLLVESERDAILRRRAAGEPDDGQPLPDPEDIDEMDIEVPGWEAKGQYVLVLDLWTDFVKLCLYAAFFFVLLSFYGLPLHIIRDLFMTVRSFIKRLGALMKYRQAMREMNRHPDATAEELARENTCIICREDMRVWNPHDPTTVERSRPKKLPCGHILHLGCLKSWMERQQVCPTCRRPVVVNQDPPNRNGDAVLFRLGLNLRGDARDAGANGNAARPNAGAGQAVNNNDGPANGQAGNGGQQQQQGGGGAVRMFNLGPLRLGFAQGGIQDIQQMAQRLGLPAGAAGQVADAAAAAMPPTVAGATAGAPPAFPAPQVPAADAQAAAPAAIFSAEAILEDLSAIERRINYVTQAMQHANAETQRLRQVMVSHQAQTAEGTDAVTAAATSAATAAATAAATDVATMAAAAAANAAPVPADVAAAAVRVTTFTRAAPLQTGHPDLPAGLEIPAGWSLIPLERFEAEAANPGDLTTPATPANPANTEGTSAAAGPSTAPDTAATAEAASTTSQATSQTTGQATGTPVWGGSAQMFSGNGEGSSRADPAD